jgi:ABC-type sugar transport system ATPase subunit
MSNDRSMLCLEAITKGFGGVPVLKGITFSIAAGEIVALVGENGSGKSTAMNVISGVLGYDTGNMRLEGDPYAPADRRVGEARGVAFIQQELTVFPNLNIADNLFLHRLPRSAGLIDRRRAADLAKPWLEAVGLDVDPMRPAASLSPGQRQLLEIARNLSSQAKLMIFDEPTTSLSPREVEHVFAQMLKLKEQGLGILFVSHVLDDVLRIADRLLVLRDGAITLDEPNEKVNRETLIQAMVGGKIETLYPSPSNQVNSESGTPLLSVEGLGARGLLDDIHLKVAPGEIVGVAGLMGAGRTELAHILFGAMPHDSGSIRLKGRLLPSGHIGSRLQAGVAFLTEDRRRDGLLIDDGITSNVALAALRQFCSRWWGTVRRSLLEKRVGALLRALKFRSMGKITTVRQLSGGNQQKLLLGRWMLCSPDFFILDEPTRGVDIGAKAEIYRLLADMAGRGMGLLVISSELEELMGLSDRIIVLARGRLAGSFSRSDFSQKNILKAMFGGPSAS